MVLNSKHSQAQILTAVLIILAVIVVVVIVYNVVIPLVSEKAENINTGFKNYLESLFGGGNISNSSITCLRSELGPELVLDGGFNNASAWIDKESRLNLMNIQIKDGKAVFATPYNMSGSSLIGQKILSLIPGRLYRFSFKITELSGYQNGPDENGQGGSYASGSLSEEKIPFSTDGDYSKEIIYNGEENGNYLYIIAQDFASGGYKIDDVSVKEVECVNTTISVTRKIIGNNVVLNISRNNALNESEILMIAEELPVGSIISNPSITCLGSELVTDGTLSDDTAWVRGAGWSLISGKVVAAFWSSINGFGNLTQSISITAGKTYQLTYYVGPINGSITPYLGGTAGITREGNHPYGMGVFTENITAGSSDTSITFVPSGSHLYLYSSGSDPSIPDVSVKEVIAPTYSDGNILVWLFSSTPPGYFGNFELGVIPSSISYEVSGSVSGIKGKWALQDTGEEGVIKNA